MGLTVWITRAVESYRRGPAPSYSPLSTIYVQPSAYRDPQGSPAHAPYSAYPGSPVYREERPAAGRTREYEREAAPAAPARVSDLPPIVRPPPRDAPRDVRSPGEGRRAPLVDSPAGSASSMKPEEEEEPASTSVK